MLNHRNSPSTSRDFNTRKSSVGSQTTERQAQKDILTTSDENTSDEAKYLEQLKRFSKEHPKFLEHFKTITSQACNIICTKSSKDVKWINAFLDEWLRIAKTAPETAALFLFDVEFDQFKNLAELLPQSGCISIQTKILDIFFTYSLYQHDNDSPNRISSLFENSGSISKIIKSCRRGHRVQPFEVVSRRILNMINANPDTKVNTLNIVPLYFDTVNDTADRTQISQDYADFNCGTNSVDFKIHLNDFSEMKAKIHDRNLECILAKGDEINVTMLTFKLIEPMRLKWKLNAGEGTSCTTSLKEFTMELYEEVDRDELQTLIEKTFPGKFKIIVTVEVHAENNYEPNIPDPSVDETIARPKPVAKQEHLDELISIPFNFDWCKILNNLDNIRAKPVLTASTPNPSDDDDLSSDNELKVISKSINCSDETQARVSSQENSSQKNSSQKTPSQADLSQKTPSQGNSLQKFPSPNKENDSKHTGLSDRFEQMYRTDEMDDTPIDNYKAGSIRDRLIRNSRKRGSFDLRDQIDSKRKRKAEKALSNDDDDKNISFGDHIGFAHLQSSQDTSSKEERCFGPNPRWNMDATFDEISGSTTYEHGQMTQQISHPDPIYSYRTYSQPKHSKLATSVTEPASNNVTSVSSQHSANSEHSDHGNSDDAISLHASGTLDGYPTPENSP